MLGEWVRRKAHQHRLTGLARLHGCHERNLVRRAVPGFAAVALATEVGFVDLHPSAELMVLSALEHRLRELGLDQPRRRP